MNAYTMECKTHHHTYKIHKIDFFWQTEMEKSEGSESTVSAPGVLVLGSSRGDDLECILALSGGLFLIYFFKKFFPKRPIWGCVVIFDSFLPVFLANPRYS